MTIPAFDGVISVAAPCKAKWEEMKGDHQVRFCGGCQKNVYSLGELTTQEIRELFIRTEGKVCWRFYTRADGTVLTKDCPAGLKRLRQRTAAGLATVGALLFGAVAGFFSEGTPLAALAGPASKVSELFRRDPPPCPMPTAAPALKAHPDLKKEVVFMGESTSY